ncbi:hypothetical protein [Aminobacter sp. HY435]|uniref:hypothetical protein n=1 Tax=Aminobacter sp. HY435 TaxID=2970917 RepID=UPI0022B947CC|nr:hypothetical protein [Aminobacter sp. HY435]
MRSLIVQAAVAAILVSTPLASALARDHDMHGVREPRISDHSGDGDSSNSSAPISGQPQLRPVGVVLSELRSDDARIAADRRMKLITAVDARNLRAEDAAIRKAAVSDAGYGGMLSAGQFSQLQAQVTGLADQINRDASRG